MDSRSSSKKSIGVIGAGSFGIVIANIIAAKNSVILYSRSEETIRAIMERREARGRSIHPRVQPTRDMEYLASHCHVIFPIVPSANFRDMIRQFSPFLHPYHILIHGTKGFDITLPKGKRLEDVKTLNRKQVKTISEVIREETVVVRVGCLAGPNIAGELAQQQPSATVVASPFEEVIQTGKQLLRSDWFQVYESSDLIGIEMAGSLKNIIAIAAGALSGLGYGENSRGLLISRGVVEMVYLGKALGGNAKAFLGVAGIGDLVTTCSSSVSRNFTVGYKLARGESIQHIMENIEEVAEGVKTVCVIQKCSRYYKVHAPITQQLYNVLFEGGTIRKALEYLMRYPFNEDISFLDP